MSLYSVGVLAIDGALGAVTQRVHFGLENIPSEGALVIVCNHLSMADPLVLAAALRRGGRRGTFLVMAEAFRWPVVGTLLRWTGQIPVTREKNAAAALAPAFAALEQGRAVALYPEGRITREADYRPEREVHTGAVRLALRADCPIVPTAQWGAHHLLTREGASSLTRAPRLLGWVRQGRVPRRPLTYFVAGRPIQAQELRRAAGDAGDLDAATDLVMDRIRVMLAGVAGQQLPGLLDD